MMISNLKKPFSQTDYFFIQRGSALQINWCIKWTQIYSQPASTAYRLNPWHLFVTNKLTSWHHRIYTTYSHQRG